MDAPACREHCWLCFGTLWLAHPGVCARACVCVRQKEKDRDAEQEEGWQAGYSVAQSHGHPREAGRQAGRRTETRARWLSVQLQPQSQAVKMSRLTVRPEESCFLSCRPYLA